MWNFSYINTKKKPPKCDEECKQLYFCTKIYTASSVCRCSKHNRHFTSIKLFNHYFFDIVSWFNTAYECVQSSGLQIFLNLHGFRHSLCKSETEKYVTCAHAVEVVAGYVEEFVKLKSSFDDETTQQAHFPRCYPIRIRHR
jgi:hypothetical protein